MDEPIELRYNTAQEFEAGIPDIMNLVMGLAKANWNREVAKHEASKTVTEPLPDGE